MAEKKFSQDVLAAVNAAASSVNAKQSFQSLAEAREALKSRESFDPSLSQFVVGTVLNFDEETLKINISNIGRDGSAVISVPAGTVGADGKVVYNRAMNVYLSSLGKTIRVTDANGEPVLDENGAQKTITGAGNPIWEAISKAKTDDDKLAVILNKEIRIDAVKRDFGPSNFVNIGDTMVPKGHKLTSLPLCSVL